MKSGDIPVREADRLAAMVVRIMQRGIDMYKLEHLKGMSNASVAVHC